MTFTRPKNTIEGFFATFLGELSLMVGKKYSDDEARILLELWYDTFQHIPLEKLLEAKRILIKDWNNGYHMPFPSHFKEVLDRMKAEVKNEEPEPDRTPEQKEADRKARDDFFARMKAT